MKLSRCSCKILRFNDYITKIHEWLGLLVTMGHAEVSRLNHYEITPGQSKSFWTLGNQKITHVWMRLLVLHPSWMFPWFEKDEFTVRGVSVPKTSL